MYLSSYKTSGIAPLDIDFMVDIDHSLYLRKNTVTRYEMDYEGDGIIDHIITDREDISHTYTQEGIYYPTITITDAQNNQYTHTTAINVLSREKMDAFFKDKWNGMRASLAKRNIEGALKFFSENSREEYRKQFTTLSSILDIIARDMKEIRLVTIEDNWAEYEIIVTRDGNTYSNQLQFVKDMDGLWKIGRF